MSACFVLKKIKQGHHSQKAKGDDKEPGGKFAGFPMNHFSEKQANIVCFPQAEKQPGKKYDQIGKQNVDKKF